MVCLRGIFVLEVLLAVVELAQLPLLLLLKLHVHNNTIK